MRTEAAAFAAPAGWCAIGGAGAAWRGRGRGRAPRAGRLERQKVAACAADGAADSAPRERGVSRRAALIGVAALAAARAALEVAAAAAAADAPPAQPVTSPTATPAERKLVTTSSGLRYTDFLEGTGATPAWGDLLTIRYITYTLDFAKGGRSLIKHDSSYERKANYIMRHGNGFQLQGLEETLHTMKEGGVRRVIIPPHMGFVSSDVGPVPEWARDRKKLNEALKQSGEFVVMDVELVEVKNIPDPHGYYSDSAPTTQEQLAKEIRETKMRRSKATASE